MSPGSTALIATSAVSQLPAVPEAEAGRSFEPDPSRPETIPETPVQADSELQSRSGVEEESTDLGQDRTIEETMRRAIERMSRAEIPQIPGVLSPPPPPPPPPLTSLSVVPGVQRSFSFGFQTSGGMGVRVEDGDEQGAVVRTVRSDGAASLAGIEVGDLITEFGGTRIVGARPLTRIVSETPAGRSIDVTVLREGQERLFEVTLANPTNGFTWNQDGFEARIRQEIEDSVNIAQLRDFDLSNRIFIGRNSRVLGAQTEDMTSELREFFGADPNAGVLVTSIESDSLGTNVGLRVGDVIVAVDGNRVDSPQGLRSLAGAVIASDNTATLPIFRDRTELELPVEP